ncbi:MAG: hypothetical protein KBC22_01225 [Candidatus Pacebacteria bacterium]|nr:hypothetical protein [Candidatus Paceibacterota bacterium]
MEKQERLQIIIATLRGLPFFDCVTLAHANVAHVFREVEKDVFPDKARMRVEPLEKMHMFKYREELHWAYCYHGHVLIFDNQGGFEIRETAQLKIILTEKYLSENFCFRQTLPLTLGKPAATLA